MKLQEKDVAVVTGAASGIGLALCRALAARGLRIVMADIEGLALVLAADDLRALGAEVEAIEVDVADLGSVQSLERKAVERFGRVDLLCNNAGVGGALGPIWDLDPNDWAWTLGVNLMGVVHGFKAFLPGMARRGRGHVVNTSSLAGLTAPPFLSPYVATKHAVVAISETTATELAALRIPVGVSVLCPGVVESRIVNSERNRPAHLGATSSPDPALLAAIRAAFDQMVTDPMDANEFARRVIKGVEAECLHILTHPQNAVEILERSDRIARTVEWQLEEASVAA